RVEQAEPDTDVHGATLRPPPARPAAGRYGSARAAVDRRRGHPSHRTARRVDVAGAPPARRARPARGGRRARAGGVGARPADHRRLITIMTTPFWDVDAAVVEVQRCADAGHRGILFTGEPQRFGLPHLGERHWDALWSVAQEAGLPVHFHIGSGDTASSFTPVR